MIAWYQKTPWILKTLRAATLLPLHSERRWVYHSECRGSNAMCLTTTNTCTNSTTGSKTLDIFSNHVIWSNRIPHHQIISCKTHHYNSWSIRKWQNIQWGQFEFSWWENNLRFGGFGGGDTGGGPVVHFPPDTFSPLLQHFPSTTIFPFGQHVLPIPT